MRKISRSHYLILVLILVVSVVVRMAWMNDSLSTLHPLEAEYGLKALDQGFSLSEGNLFAVVTKWFISLFGNTASAIKMGTVAMSVLTIWGVYLLVKQLFHWKVAALSSFLLSTSFWYLYYSRLGFEVILIPLITTWSLYFLWKSLKHGNSWLALIAGIIAGLGAYTHLSFISVAIIYIALIWNYFSFISTDYIESEYRHGSMKLIQSSVVFTLVALAVASPIIFNYLTNSGEVLSSSVNLSYGDMASNARGTIYLLYGPTVMAWPLAALAVIGLVRELVHWLRRKHGHFSTVHTLIFMWLIAGLVPGLFARHSPDTFLTFNTVVPLTILAAQALWWLGKKIEAWDETALPGLKFKKVTTSSAVIGVIALTIAVGAVELNKYKNVVTNPSNQAFDKYVEVAQRINEMPQKTNKYILVNTQEENVKYIIQYLTDTGTNLKQNEKRTWYISQQEFKKGAYTKNSVIIPLEK